jgi:hypothetical protein
MVMNRQANIIETPSTQALVSLSLKKLITREAMPEKNRILMVVS